MSIGSLFSGIASTATLAQADASASAAKTREGARTIADHVAAAEQEPAPAASATLGTLVDTYL
ncbi:hypothetical protein ACFQFC_39885 [Amorphoplanes digitatis]|uniref:Uncharacterized protein n=1 Tax=Actinoplanes digitatis TaxID=1868 RepID=A0A7W7MPP2_9ACTN|nr:hypothetical protein [Actinoplanes digitatis]MBB4762336.1 hypothetical protein [Actinoplanes digitatis]GID92542.1 hypothetical protein Adi01nite_19540 [Actinoplanes digitatis]